MRDRYKRLPGNENIIFIKLFIQQLMKELQNELDASIADQVARINERLLVFSMEMYNGKSKSGGCQLRQSPFKKEDNGGRCIVDTDSRTIYTPGS